MAHEELVLRFFAYYSSGYKRAKNLSFFLTEYQKKNQNPSKKTLNELEHLFDATIKLVHEYIGNNAFSSCGKSGKWTSTSNRSLYDAEMLAFSDFVDKKINITPSEFKVRLQKLMSDIEFRKSLNSQAGGTMIEKRVSKIKNIILNKL